MSSENCRVKVIVRARPPVGGENSTVRVYDDQPGLVTMRAPTTEGGEVTEREFLFDEALGIDTCQSDVFEKTCKSQIDHVLDGFNACLFAYGQTGSGKTYTIFGEDGDKKGIAPRAMDYLFSSMKRRAAQKKFTVFVSFLELYLDKLRDIGVHAGEDGRVEFKGPGSKPSSRPGTAGSRKSAGGADGEPKDLEIRENPNGGVYVQDLSSIPVSSAEEVMAVIKAGLTRRQTYQTLMNEHSSRSHTIVTITVVAESKSDSAQSVTGKYNLVDLAGCERLKRSGAGDQASGIEDSGMRAKEAVIINKSLSTLGNVVMALAKGDASYVPYRDAKLTRLLQDSLGGNSYTALLATIHPRAADAEESLNTLQFANRCRNVTTQPHVNFLDADRESQSKIIEQLMKEIANLKQELGAQKEHYETKLERLSKGASASASDLASTLQTQESLPRQAEAAGEGGDADMPRLPSRGTSRGSKRGATGDTKPRSATGVSNEAQAQALQEAQALSREMKEKFVKKNNEFRAAQDAARNNELRLKKEIDEYRTKVTNLSETMTARTLEHELKNEECAARYEKEIEQLKEHNNKLLNDMDAALRSVPEKLRVDSDKLRSADQRIRENAEAKDKEMTVALEKSSKDAARVLELQREQYEFWLTAKTDELKKMLAEFTVYKAEKTAQLNTLEKHSIHLFDYCNALATIMANFDKGLYPVYEKTGIKTVHFPPHAKPGPMSAETIRDILKFKKRADEFIRGHPAGLTVTYTEANPLGRTLSNANTGGKGDGGERNGEEVRLRDEVETLRRALAEAEEAAQAHKAQVRATVEEQVLSDLSDHPTVEYIKRIEDERTYYKEQLHEEVRRNKDLRVALDAKQRVIDKTITSSQTLRYNSGVSGSSRFPPVPTRQLS